MDRQQRGLKHDKFVDEVGTWSTRAKGKPAPSSTITATAVVIAVLAYGIYFYRSNHEEKAKLALGQAMDTIESPPSPRGAQPQPGRSSRRKRSDGRGGEAAQSRRYELWRHRRR
jgi:hypothetical protein